MEGSAEGADAPAPSDYPEPQTSFDELPLELRLKCLANCDWQTLSRAACVNRSTRALVSVSGQVL